MSRAVCGYYRAVARLCGPYGAHRWHAASLLSGRHSYGLYSIDLQSRGLYRYGLVVMVHRCTPLRCWRADKVLAYIVTIFIVMASTGMVYVVMVHRCTPLRCCRIVTAYIVMASIGKAHKVMAHRCTSPRCCPAAPRPTSTRHGPSMPARRSRLCSYGASTARALSSSPAPSPLTGYLSINMAMAYVVPT